MPTRQHPQPAPAGLSPGLGLAVAGSSEAEALSAGTGGQDLCQKLILPAAGTSPTVQVGLLRLASVKHRGSWKHGRYLGNYPDARNKEQPERTRSDYN